VPGGAQRFGQGTDDIGETACFGKRHHFGSHHQNP
jgi:hypothetical protein